jgi:acid phosphatase type 7
VRLVPGLLVAAVLCTAAGDALARSLKKGPYLQHVTPTSVVVLWQTHGSEPGTLRVIGPAYDRTIEVKPARLQEVVVEGLRPATRYAYEVRVGGTVETGEVATAPEHGAQVPFTFVVYGDTRSQVDAHRRVIERIRGEVPDFLLGTGDLVDDGGKEHQWQQFFDIEQEVLRDNCLFPAVGNHDRQGRGRTADAWRTYFAVPENSPDPERYYAFTYGNSHVIVLDSNMYSFALTDQTAWLERQLRLARQDPSIRHVFVVMHHPPFSISLHGGHRDLRERWTPLYEKYGVDAVFSGHDHVYGRAEHGGVHYFVSGGGGAPLYPRSPRATAIDRQATRYFERVNHYLRVHVYGDLVEVTAIRADGTTIETTSWGAPPPVAPLPGAPAADAPPKAVVAPVIAQAGAAAVREAAAPPQPPSGRGVGLPLGLGMIGAVAAIGAGWALARRRRPRGPATG